MFERFTEKARQVVFWARFEASQFASPYIETEHLLLGLLRVDKALAHRLLGTTSSESIRQQVEARVVRGGEAIPTSVDLPLSHECKRVLAYGAEEAELKHKHIGTDHLLLGLLREENNLAATLLREHGLKLVRVREILAGDPSAPAGRFRNTLAACLGAQQKERGIPILIAPRVGSGRPDIGVYAGELKDPTLGVPPLICVDVLCSEDRFREVVERLDAYFARGVRYVWLLDPVARRAYVASASAGLREFKGRVLKTDSPAVELPLDQIFS